VRSLTYRVVQQTLRLVGEAAWLLAWSAVLGYWLDPTVGPALPLWLVCGVLLLAAALSNAVSRRATVGYLPIAVSFLGVAVSVGAGLLVAALADGKLDLRALGSTVTGSRAFVAGCLALVAWWRGSRLGANRPSLYEVEGQFRFGVLAAAGLLALIAVLGTGAAPDPATLVEPALALVASGLLGVPLARISEVSAERRADSPRLEPSGPWLGTLLGVVGVLMLLTLLFAGVVTLERLGAVFHLVLGALWSVISAIILVLAVPAGYLVGLLVDLLKGRIRDDPAQLTPPGLPPIDQVLREQQRSGAMPAELELILDILAVAGIVFVIVALLSRTIAGRSRWERESDGVEELRESVFGWETIRELIAWVLGRLRPPRVVASVPLADPDPVQPRSVREVYREFLRLTARLGFPRARAETPLEYARRIERDRLSGQNGSAADGPDVSADLDSLTSTYVRVRYGPRTDSPSDVGPAARALERLRALWTRR
jgi:uncharacterized protein DUF4129